ncbi:MAG: hypothetical protein P8127_06210 [Acidobacteriota bacterium]
MTLTYIDQNLFQRCARIARLGLCLVLAAASLVLAAGCATVSGK